MSGIYLSLGTNLDNREENLKCCLRLISSHASLRMEGISSIYESEPVGFVDQPWFLNMVIRISTTLTPLQLLKLIQRLEVQVGRKKTFHWGPRIIDIDIIDYFNKIINHPKLKLPHRQLHARQFVLIPLKEIADRFFHPELKKDIDQLLEECPDNSLIKWYMNGNQLLTNET